MCIVHEKYLTTTATRQVKRNKKKSTSEEKPNATVYTPNDKERINIVTSIINRLKTEINTIDAAVGKLNLHINSLSSN